MMENRSTRALLLNSTYEALHFVSDIRAILLIYKGRAEVVSVDGMPSVWNERISTPTMSISVPATIRLFNRVSKRWKVPRFRKKVLFNRDGWQCQYCAELLNWNSVTIDHVLPTSRGGLTSWKNCVTSCRSCNRKKANMLPEEAGMRLLGSANDPNPLHFWDSARTAVWHPHWDTFVPNMNT